MRKSGYIYKTNKICVFRLTNSLKLNQHSIMYAIFKNKCLWTFIACTYFEHQISTIDAIKWRWKQMLWRPKNKKKQYEKARVNTSAASWIENGNMLKFIWSAISLESYRLFFIRTHCFLWKIILRAIKKKCLARVRYWSKYLIAPIYTQKNWNKKQNMY